jgi:Restriction endonuclease
LAQAKKLEDHKKVKVGNSLASLNLMRTTPKYHLKMRSYCQQEYDVDQACHVLIMGRDHTKQSIKALEESQSTLLNFKPYFITIQIAIKKLLGFGTRAYDPFILVLAPIYVKETLEEIQVMPENISAKKERIRIQFNQAKNHPIGNATEINDKGRPLEQVISQIICLVRDLHVVGTRIDDGIQEIDIYVRNHNKKYVWADLEGMIFIECKNWADRVGSTEIMAFGQKLKNKGLRSGVFVAMNGITGKDIDGAKGQVRNFLQQGVKIIIIDGTDIEDILDCKDAELVPCPLDNGSRRWIETKSVSRKKIRSGKVDFQDLSAMIARMLGR